MALCMRFLLSSFAFAAASAVAAATNLPSDDNACAVSDDDAQQLAGHRSMLHVRTESKSSRAAAALASHRRARDEYLMRFTGQNSTSREDLMIQVKELSTYLEALGFPDSGKEGHIYDEGDLALQTRKYDEWATAWGFKTICETGFNGGDSALRFLAQTEATVYEFDLCDHGYARPAAAYLNSKYPGRLNLTCGNSVQTVAAFHHERPDVKCDLIIIDGGHQLDVALADLNNLALMANENALVVIDDTPCEAFWCMGPNSAWNGFVKDGCIAAETRLAMNEARGFSYGLLQECDRLKKLRR